MEEPFIDDDPELAAALEPTMIAESSGHSVTATGEKLIALEEEELAAMLDANDDPGMAEDMAALMEIEAHEPAKRNERMPWDKKMSKRRLTLNNSVNREEERQKNTKVNKKTRRQKALLPTLHVSSSRDKRKENVSPSDIFDLDSEKKNEFDDIVVDEGRDINDDDDQSQDEIEDNALRMTVPLSGDYIPLTGPDDGERYYLEVEPKALREYRLKKSEAKHKSKGSRGRMIDVDKLLRELDEDERNDFHANAIKAAGGENLSEDAGVGQKKEEKLNRKKGRAAKRNRGKKRNKQSKKEQKAGLWVDKYRPRRFTELLSSERINRQVLGWLKAWDPIVFPNGKDSPGVQRRKKDVNSALGSAKKRQKLLNQPFQQDDSKNDKDKGPEQRIILLSGPPGLGKTTLAHVAARHSGYRVVEINASDDRTESTLINKVRAATQMQSVFAKDGRPNCLVIDEIDGSCRGSEGLKTINALVKLVQGSPQAKKKEAEEDEKKSKKTALSRPIICICNDAYSPALRPLRAIAMCFEFKKPSSSSSLVERLRHICRKESLQADLSALQLMCTTLNGDIRSCLNMLQFIKAKSNSLTTESMGRSDKVEKDVSRDKYDIWSLIFQKRQADLLRTKSQPLSVTGQLLRKASCVAGHGDYDKILEGVHFNYPHQPYVDVDVAHTAEAAEYLSIADVFGTHSRKNSGFVSAGAGRYIPFCCVGVNHECSTLQPSYLHFPRADMQLRFRQERNTSVLRSFLSSNNTFARAGLECKNVTVEILSPLLDIIAQPKMKVEGRMSERQKTEYRRLINTYNSLGITFSPAVGFEKGACNESTQSFKYATFQKLELDPPIHSLASFGRSFQQIVNPNSAKSYRDPTRASLPNLATECPILGSRPLPHKFKEKVRRDAEIALIRAAASKDISSTSTAAGLGTEGKGQRRQNGDSHDSKGPSIKTIEEIMENAQRLKEPSLTKMQQKRKPVGNFLMQARKKLQKKKAKDGRRKTSAIIMYNFQEGFTNAVRRPVFMKDFLV